MNRNIVIAALAIYAAAVFTAVVIQHRVALASWSKAWRDHVADRRESLREAWLQGEGVENA